jgi:hypothetical protein
MRRRALLAGLASAGTLTAGCLGTVTDEPGDGSTATPTPTSPPTATPPETELTVEFETLQPALVELNTDYYQLIAEEDRQYLVLAVSVDSGAPPSRSDLAVRFDGAEHATRTWERIPARQSDGSGGDQYSAESGSGWVAFDLPETGDASDAALVWPGGEWRPDDQLRAQLSTPSPSLSLAEWRVPETVPLDGTTAFEMAVRNDGDRTGWFVGGINAEGWYPHRPIACLSRRIPAGETVSWEVPGEAIELEDEAWSERVGDGETDIRYELIWPGGSEERPVRVVEE